MSTVRIERCSIEKPFSPWYQDRIGETFRVVYEENDYLVVYDGEATSGFNRRVLKTDGNVTE